MNLENVRVELENYDAKIKNFLCGIIEFGFAVVAPAHVNKIPSYEVSNYSSVFKACEQVSKGLADELEADKIEIVSEKPRCVSARGAVPKRDYNEPNGESKTKYRIITDASRPLGKALNEWYESPSFSYATYDQAVKLSSRGCWYAKIDLKAAYRHIALHPATWCLFGFEWDGNYYIDKFLPFGVKSACWLFTQFTNAICWRARYLGVKAILGYLDDFLIIGNSKEECLAHMNIVFGILKRMGFEVAVEKCEGPVQTIVFLGLVFDSNSRTITLPTARKNFVLLQVNEFLTKKSCTLKELQSLIGFLSYASKVVYGGRTFTRRLINLTCIKNGLPHHHIRLTSMAKSDLIWWRDFLSIWEGKAILLDPLPVAAEDFQIDASGNASLGCGAFWNGKILQEHWSPEVSAMIQDKKLYSSHLEVYPMLMAAKQWHCDWSGKHVIVYTDNKAAMAAINSGTAKNDLVMSWLRDLFFLSAIHNFRITARYVPGKFNKLADALSRFMTEKYLRFYLFWRKAKNGDLSVFFQAPWLEELFKITSKNHAAVTL